MVIMAGGRWLRAAFVNNLLNQQRLSRQQKALVPTLTGRVISSSKSFRIPYQTPDWGCHDTVRLWRGQ